MTPYSRLRSSGLCSGLQTRSLLLSVHTPCTRLCTVTRHVQTPSGTVGLGNVLAAAHRSEGPGSGACGAGAPSAVCSPSPAAADLLVSQDFGGLEYSLWGVTKTAWHPSNSTASFTMDNILICLHGLLV